MELKKLEAAKEIVENLSKSKNVVFISNSKSEGESGVGGSSNFLFKIWEKKINLNILVF